MATTHDSTISARTHFDKWCAALKTSAATGKDRLIEIIDNICDFTDKWVCCNGVDDDEVVQNVRRIREVPDGIAEDYLEFNHQPKIRHYTTQPSVIDVIDNKMPEMAMAEPAIDSTIGPEELTAQLTTTPVGTASPTHNVSGGVVAPTITSNEHTVCGANESDGHGPTDKPAETQDALSSEHSQGSGKPGAAAPTLVYTICHDAIEVKNSRRIATNGRKFYNATVVAEIKNKLGLPKCTEANKLVVRRMARNIMERHGVRPTHVRQSIEKIVAGVFVPDQYDIEASAMLTSNVTADLRRQVDNSGPKNGWSVVKDLFRFGWRRREASRVPPVTGSP